MCFRRGPNLIFNLREGMCRKVELNLPLIHAFVPFGGIKVPFERGAVGPGQDADSLARHSMHAQYARDT